MKYLIVDDEHILYKRMFADCFKNSKYDITEIPRMIIPKILKPLYQIHFNEKINRHLWLPFKSLWKRFYGIQNYHFDKNEKYCIVFLNGSLRLYFSKKYMLKFKKNHPNVKLVMILYDSFSNKSAKRSIDMIPVFDYVFSFDPGDCERHGFEYIYSTFSKPDLVSYDVQKKSTAFFIGFGMGRLSLLQNTFAKITKELNGCRFYITGVKIEDQKPIKDVVYNKTMFYDDEMQMIFNTDCVIEVVREGQTGVTLRTCEAVVFNKKLLTNNSSIRSMPFYDSRYMRVFDEIKESDIEFIKNKIPVKYDDCSYFSPLKIFDRLSELEMECE